MPPARGWDCHPGLVHLLRPTSARGDGAVKYDEDRDRWVRQIDLGADAPGKHIRAKVAGQDRAQTLEGAA